MSDYGITFGKSLKKNEKLLKVFKQGTIAVNVTGPDVWVATITHGLGYHPVYVFQAAPDPTNPQRRYFGHMGASVPLEGGIGLDSQIDKNELKLAWLDNSDAPGYFRAYPYTVTFYYYIFYDRLESE